MSVRTTSLVKSVKQYNYIEDDLLGQGATGEVYLGVDSNNNRKVAVKVINMAEINNQVTQYLLENQKRALSSIKHHNVIECLDIVQDQNHCYIITEYCNGGTLHEHIRRAGFLKQNEALSIFKSVVQGYKQCSQQGVVHRDLKPANILLSNGVPKISDFGYCECRGMNRPSMYYNVGSPSYMSPEAYLNNIYSQKSDIWALGITLYEMLAGRTLDQGAKLMDSIHKISRQGIPLPSGTSNYVKSLVSDCLNLNANQRIGVDALLQKLNNPQINIVVNPTLPLGSQTQLNKQNVQMKSFKTSTTFSSAQVNSNRLSVPSSNNIVQNSVPQLTPNELLMPVTHGLNVKSQTAPTQALVVTSSSLPSATSLSSTPYMKKSLLPQGQPVREPMIIQNKPPVVVKQSYIVPQRSVPANQPTLLGQLLQPPNKVAMTRSLHVGAYSPNSLPVTASGLPLISLKSIEHMQKMAQSEIFLQPPGLTERMQGIQILTHQNTPFLAHHKNPALVVPLNPVTNVNNVPVPPPPLQINQNSFKKRTYVVPPNMEPTKNIMMGKLPPRMAQHQTSYLMTPPPQNIAPSQPNVNIGVPTVNFTHYPVQPRKQQYRFPAPKLIHQKQVGQPHFAEMIVPTISR